MISYLVGKPILCNTNNTATILVGGVGYEVHLTPQLASKIASSPEVSLFIYTHVREEILALYGFETVAERALFLMVLSVSGVGPATALPIVGAGANQVIEAIQQARVPFFTAIPRIGKKLAQKIIIELSSKLGEMKKLNLEPQSPLAADLTESLLQLGFAEDVVTATITEIDIETVGLEKALKLALKKLSGKSGSKA